MRKNLRQYAIVIISIALALIFTSCAASPSADTVAFKLLKLYSKIPPSSQYVKNGEEGEYGYISPESFSFLYTGRREKLPEWELISDFRIILSDSDRPFELHVIRVHSSSDTDEIKKLLEKRAAMIRYHNKTELSYKTYEPSVFVYGRYAVLAVTEDNEAVKMMLKKIL